MVRTYCRVVARTWTGSPARPKRHALNIIRGINTSTGLVWPGVVVVRFGGKVRERVLYQVTKLGDAGCRFVCVQNTIKVAYHAIMERVFYHKTKNGWERPVTPTSECIRDRLRWFASEVRRRSFAAAKLPWEVFPQRYVGRRRVVYDDALKSLLLKPLGVNDATIRSFVKAEKLPYGKKPVVPRIISPRSPRYNLVLGCYLSHLEHVIYDIVGDIIGGKTITKGLNSEQVGELMSVKWQAQHNTVAYGLDASRFDQHVSRSMLQWEHSIYQMFYRGRDREELRSLLGMQLRNKCVCNCDDGRIRYTTDGTRCSGDMNTALGNCLIMCAIIATYMRDKRIKYGLINNGDDCVLFLDGGTSVSDIADYFAIFGFVLKVEAPAYNLEEVEFCQAHPVYDGVQWRLIRNPKVSISKDSITVKPISHPDVYPRYLKAVGDCGLSQCHGLPVLQAYYQAMIRAAGNVNPLEDPSLESGFYWLSKGLRPGRHRKVTVAARKSFGLAFGVSEEEQRRMERYYDDLDLVYTEGVRFEPSILW